MKRLTIAVVLFALVFVPATTEAQGGASALRRIPWQDVGIWLRNELPKDVIGHLIAAGVISSVEHWWVGGKTPNHQQPQVENLVIRKPGVDPINPSKSTPFDPIKPGDRGPFETKLPPPGRSWTEMLPPPTLDANSLFNQPEKAKEVPPARPNVPPSYRPQTCSGAALGPEKAFEIGYQFDTGRGVGRRDPQLARDCYVVSASQGSLYAKYLLAHSYLYDEPKKLQDGLTSLTEVAEAGFVYAQVELGDIYHPSDGVQPNRSRAMYWYRAAADQQIGYAEYQLALLYAQGGVPDDQIRAFEWLREALLDRYDGAVDEMRRMLDGYHRRAMQDGDPELLFLFGEAHEFGVPEFIWPEPWEAGSYYCDAARDGYRPARNAFAALHSRHPGLPVCN